MNGDNDMGGLTDGTGGIADARAGLSTARAGLTTLRPRTWRLHDREGGGVHTDGGGTRRHGRHAGGDGVRGPPRGGGGGRARLAPAPRAVVRRVVGAREGGLCGRLDRSDTGVSAAGGGGVRVPAAAWVALGTVPEPAGGRGSHAHGHRRGASRMRSAAGWRMRSWHAASRRWHLKPPPPPPPLPPPSSVPLPPPRQRPRPANTASAVARSRPTAATADAGPSPPPPPAVGCRRGTLCRAWTCTQLGSGNRPRGARRLEASFRRAATPL